MITSNVYGISASQSPLDIFGDIVTIKVSGDRTGGKYTVITGKTPPLGGPPLHTHLHDAETFVVLSGRFLFELDGKPIEAETGDVVHITPGTKHLYQNIGPDFGELLYVVAPGGLDSFFVELDQLLKSSDEPPMPEIAVLHAKYGMELLGPPLAAR